MANETLKVVLTAQDSTAAAFSSLQSKLSSVEGTMTRLQSSFGKLGAALGVSFGAGALASGAKALADYSDQWTGLSNRLKAAGLSTTEAADAQSEIVKIAQRSRTEFTAVADLYARMTLASQGFGASQKEVADVTEAISKVFSMSGKTAEEAKSAAIQLGQALASGVLQGDELRSLRENAPELVRAIADEFNLTVGQLKEAGAKGELEASRVFKAILNIAPRVDEQFKASQGTFAQFATAVSNSVYSLIDAFKRATAESEAYLIALEKISKKRAEIEKQSGAPAQQENAARAQALTEASDALRKFGTGATSELSAVTAELTRFESIVSKALAAGNVPAGEFQKILKLIQDALKGGVDEALALEAGLKNVSGLGLTSDRITTPLSEIAKAFAFATAKVEEYRKQLQATETQTVTNPGTSAPFFSGLDKAKESFRIGLEAEIAKGVIDDAVLNSAMSEAEKKILAAKEALKKRLGEKAMYVSSAEMDAAAKKIVNNEASAEAAKNAEKEAEALQALADQYKLIADPLLKYNLQLQEAANLYRQNKLTADEYANAVKNIEDQKAKAAARTDPMKDSIKELERAIEGFGKKSADAFAEFVVTGKGNFRDLIQSMLKELISFFAYQSLFKPLFSMLGGGGGSFLDIFKGFLGGGIGSSMYPPGTIMGPPMPPGLATGGSVSAGRAYIVGEKGPELFMPNGNGSIIPNHALGGSGNVVVNVINQAGVEVETSQNERPDGMKEITMMIRREVSSGISNGSYDKQFRSAYGLTRQGY